MFDVVVSVGLGALSVLLGVVAVVVSRKSGRQMKALADLAFDEKGAVMEHYEAGFRQLFKPEELEKFKWDLSALTHVARWAEADKQARVGRMVDGILKSIAGKASKEDVERIRQLRAKLR